jgi:hypothetical protein
MSCIDPSVRIVTKSPKVGPLLIFSISLGDANSAEILKVAETLKSAVAPRKISIIRAQVPITATETL